MHAFKKAIVVVTVYLGLAQGFNSINGHAPINRLTFPPTPCTVFVLVVFETMNKLINMNDNGDPFPVIADYIETIA